VPDLNKKIYATIEPWRNRPIEGEHPSIRPVTLSITHNFRPDDRAQLDVGQVRQSGPHDRITRRGVIGSGEIPAQDQTR
jgi:hypothetical protein